MTTTPLGDNDSTRYVPSITSPTPATTSASPFARKAVGLLLFCSSNPTKLKGNGGAVGGGGGGGATGAAGGGGGGGGGVQEAVPKASPLLSVPMRLRLDDGAEAVGGAAVIGDSGLAPGAGRVGSTISTSDVGAENRLAATKAPDPARAATKR